MNEVLGRPTVGVGGSHMITDGRHRIDYNVSGNECGPTIVLVPGSCSTGSAWRPVVACLGDRFRCVTTSLPGYGGTSERRTPADTAISRVTEAVTAVIQQAGGKSIHLVGHSFGGLVSLAAVLEHEVQVASLTVIEAPAVELLKATGEHEHYSAFRKMTDTYFQAFHGGDRQAIVGMIDFYGGVGTYASWPERVRAYAVETTPVNILDWASAFAFGLSPSILAGVRIPLLVLVGEASHQAVQRANGLLSRSVAAASLETIAGAAHFMISTHAEDVARAIETHIDRVLGG